MSPWYSSPQDSEDDLVLAISDILSCMPLLTFLLVITLYTINRDVRLEDQNPKCKKFHTFFYLFFPYPECRLR